jgi:hypothetical protein
MTKHDFSNWFCLVEAASIQCFCTLNKIQTRHVVSHRVQWTEALPLFDFSSKHVSVTKNAFLLHRLEL